MKVKLNCSTKVNKKKPSEELKMRAVNVRNGSSQIKYLVIVLGGHLEFNKLTS